MRITHGEEEEGQGEHMHPFIKRAVVAFFVLVVLIGVILLVNTIRRRHRLATQEFPEGLSASEGSSTPVKGKLNIKLEEKPSVPSMMTVYMYQFPIQTVYQAKEFASQKFGMEGDVQERGSEHPCWIVRDGSLSFSVFPDEGKWIYTDYDKYGQASPNLPSKEEAPQIAMDKLSQMGLLPPDAFASEIGGETKLTSNEAGEEIKLKICVDVAISRKVGDYKVFGPGFETKVSLGSNGEITTIFSSMKDLIPIGEKEAISFDDAVKCAQEGKGTVNVLPDVENPTVTGFEIIYYADVATTSENNYLLPAYALLGGDVCIYVPAVYLSGGG